MSPVCLDLASPLPCKHLCIIAKTSCGPALRRKGIEWPKFLDCSRFPKGHDGCISRQPLLETEESLNSSSPSTVLKSRPLEITSTTMAPPSTQLPPATTSIAAVSSTNVGGGVSSHHDYSSMPVNVTHDLTQLLCSITPEWLIKTKLTDSQLMGSVLKRKLKVRSYRQIFGSLPGNNGTIESINQPQNLQTKASGSKSISTNLYLSLSNTTVFVSAMGSNIYTQPISDALQARASGYLPNVTETKSTRYYLVAGSGSSGHTKLANMFVVWPTGRLLTNDHDSQGGVNIIKTYRDFKRKGANVCSDRASAAAEMFFSSPEKSLMFGEMATSITTESLMSTPNGQQVDQQPTRRRKNKKKNRVQNISE